MPDNYITSKTEKGNINISEDVVAAIAAAAISEVEGVAGMSGAAVLDLVSKRAAVKGVRVSFAAEAVTVDAAILVRQGAIITVAAEKAQSAAAAAVESTTGLRSVVNIHVSGVAFEK